LALNQFGHLMLEAAHAQARLGAAIVAHQIVESWRKTAYDADPRRSESLDPAQSPDRYRKSWPEPSIAGLAEEPFEGSAWAQVSR
jgi:hypothetical protein